MAVFPGVTVCFLAVWLSYGTFETQGYSEPVNFSRLRSSFKPIMGIVGMPVEIDCSVDSKNVIIDLYKSTNIKREKLVPNGKTLKRKGNVFTLVIQSFRDTGKYICTAKRYGTLYEKAITIAVVGTARDMTPRPDIFPGVAKPMKGQSVTLTCSAAGTLSILRWYKDGQRVISDGKNIIINETFLQASRVSVSKLSITSAKTSDSGTYKCAVTTKLDSGYLSYIEAKIKVNDANLAWTSSLQRNVIMVAAQTAVVLDCSLNIPNVKVSFFRQSKKGALFQLPVKAGRYEVLGEQQLLIRSVSIDDIGMYVCKAEGVEDKKTSIFITPGKDICTLFKPSGLRTLCYVNRNQFRQFVSGLMRHMEQD